MTTQKGEYKPAAFLDEQRMSRLYEKFILEYYAKECPQSKVSASQILWVPDMHCCGKSCRESVIMER